MIRHAATLLLAFGLLLGGAATTLPAQDLGDDAIGISPAILERLTPPQQRRDDLPPQSSRCRGAYLRTETRGRKSTYQLVAALSTETDNAQLTVQLDRQEIQTITEVRIYETLLRTFVPGETEDQGTYDYKRLDGEIWEGESNQRTLTLPAGPLVSTKVLLNGVELSTDRTGLVRDPDCRLDLLASFDDLSTRSLDLEIKAQGYDPLHLTLTRTMPKRRASDERQLDEDESGEVLLAYGLDFQLSRGKPEQDALVCRVRFPKDCVLLEAGKPVPVTVEVENPGSTQTSCLIARTFSRLEGLDGKLFYFGAIPPGGKRAFTRMITIPATEKASRAMAEIRFSDSWSIPPQVLRIDLPLVR